jgi:competence protein ComEA
MVVMLAAAAVGALAGVALLKLYDDWRAPDIIISDPAPGSTIAVSVDGAVATPGVYRLAGDSRLIDAVEMAGGLQPNADLGSINLAARIHDEDRLIVPTMVAVAADREPGSLEESTAPLGIRSSQTGRVNINTASAEELDKLPGIGPALANLIIKERTRLGRFISVDQLAAIPGISARMVDEMRDLITV